MSELLGNMKRTEYCGNLRMNNIGEEVTVMGWVQKRRAFGSLLFVDLRDREGIVQLVFDSADSKELFDKADKIRSEYVIACKGVVRERSNKTDKIATGDIEISAKELKILSEAETPPFEIVENSDVNDELRLKHRYLDLRRPDLQRNIIMRHKIAKLARDYFDKNGFLEIETPMLMKSTPEGARDYVVPSRVQNGKFYALPQSPQLYKQLLMVSGFDRYMQITRCFRDEDLRADRQPEFTQIDLEMSFVDEEDVMSINEGFLKKIFREVLNVEIQTPFIRMPYSEAMERFGSDKPDIRFGFELCNISDICMNMEFKVFSQAVKSGGSVRAIKIDGGAEKFSRRDIDAMQEFVKTYRAKGLAYIKINTDSVQCSFSKFVSEEEISEIIEKTGAQTGDLILIVADRDEIVFDALGNLRCYIANKLDILKDDDYKFLWVTKFPLFEYSEEENRFVSKHHPFTSPLDEDLEFMDSDPSKVRAKAYDIVLNGVEIGGGSIRISNSEIQNKMFKNLGFTKEEANEKFSFLLEAFKYGVPPHGGLAYGLDRLCMLMAHLESIRDCIAFPKVQNASELMSGCPSYIEQKQLKELGL